MIYICCAMYDYCERSGSGLFAEPFNTISNFVFVWAAVEAWTLAGRYRVRTRDMSLLIFLSAAVGVGSALWHMFATPWAHLMDVIPILIFQVCFVWLYLRTCGGVKPVFATVLVCGYFITLLLMRQLPPYLNRSILYAPTTVVLLGLGAYHYITRQPDRSLLALVAVLFCAAVMFRSIDFIMCPWVPFGTHFLWHVLNGAVFYCAMRAIILKRASQSAAARLS